MFLELNAMNRDVSITSFAVVLVAKAILANLVSISHFKMI
jgi:hypothetical protein